MNCTTFWYVLIGNVFLFSWTAFFLKVSLVLTYKPRPHVHSKFLTGLLKLFCIVSSFSVHKHGFVGPFLGNGRCSSTATVTHPVPEKAVAHLPAPLCLPGCVARPSFPLAVCPLLQWLILGGCRFLACVLAAGVAPTVGSQWESPSSDHLRAAGRCWGVWACSGRSTWGLHKTYCGVLGESTKGGEREGLGQEQARKTGGEGYKRGWSHVNKRLVSAHVWPGCQSGLSLRQYCIQYLSWCAWLRTYIHLYNVQMCVPVPYWECNLSLASAWTWAHGSWAASPLPGTRFGEPYHHRDLPCWPRRGRELRTGYGSGVYGCLVTPGLDRANLGFEHFCLPEVPSASGKTSGFTCTEIRGS